MESQEVMESRDVVQSQNSSKSLGSELLPLLTKHWKTVCIYGVTHLATIGLAIGLCRYYLQEVVTTHASNEIKPYMSLAHGFLAGGFAIDSTNSEVPMEAIEELDFASAEFLKRGETKMASTAIGGLSKVIASSSSPVELENYNRKIKNYMKDVPFTPAICEGLSLYALRTGDPDAALEYATKGLAISSDLGDSLRASDFKWSLAKTAVAQGQLDNAVKMIKEANQLDPEYYLSLIHI